MIKLVETNAELDSVGNELTSEQSNYFKNSKIRDKQGRLLVCYHGTSSPGFTEFSPSNNKSQFGKYKFGNYNVNYFSTDLHSASSYTEFGYEDNGNVYYCYLNIENPYIVDNKTEYGYRSPYNINDSRIRQSQINTFDRIFKKWNSRMPTIEDIDEVNHDLAYLNLEFIVADGYDDIGDLCTLGNNSINGQGRIILYSYTLDEIFEDDMYDELKEEVLGDVEEENSHFSTDEVVRYVISMNEDEGTNYDGIIIEDISDSKNMFDLGTDVITLDSSNQIKLISNKNPTNSNKINETYWK